jgi:hypothetical protein
LSMARHGQGLAEFAGSIQFVPGHPDRHAVVAQRCAVGDQFLVYAAK